MEVVVILDRFILACQIAVILAGVAILARRKVAPPILRYIPLVLGTLFAGLSLLVPASLMFVRSDFENIDHCLQSDVCSYHLTYSVVRLGISVAILIAQAILFLFSKPQRG